jgi:dipeptidase E
MKTTPRQIIAMGGGGCSMEPENPALDLYVLAQTRKRNPSVCFLATATGDADGYIEKFYDAFKPHRCRPTHVPSFAAHRT